jgi:P-type Cu2+ transporter
VGGTEVFVARGGSHLGSILIADEVRPSARPAVKALEKMNIRVVLLTGDSAEVAEDLANQLGIITFRSDLLPEDKSAAIARQVRKTER